MAGLNVIAAPSEEEALLLFTSLQQAFINLRTGRPAPLPPPAPNLSQSLDPALRPLLDQTLSRSVVGAPATVRRKLDAFLARTGADEIIATAQIFDHDARIRSFEILADVHAAQRSAA
jgi:alkanesulfonate monooxygenase SsuD/methylene tetrahydromethanopterin reductase-like flavin-dependent oxidoreductase (luciferase family)